MDHSHPSKKSLFEILGSLFKKHSIQPVLIGGYAIIAYKIQRMTFDIDFIITQDDFLKIEPEILDLGYSIFNKNDVFVQLRSETFGLRDIDFLLSDTKTLGNLIQQGKNITIAGQTFIVPSLLHILAMKLHAMVENKERELKDLPDVVQLLSVNGIDPASDEIRTIFENYCAMEMYEKVIKAVENGNK